MKIFAILLHIAGIASAFWASVYWFRSASVTLPSNVKKGDTIREADQNQIILALKKSGELNRMASIFAGVSAALFGIVWIIGGII